MPNQRSHQHGPGCGHVIQMSDYHKGQDNPSQMQQFNPATHTKMNVYLEQKCRGCGFSRRSHSAVNHRFID
jgi:hypothetical protein